MAIIDESQKASYIDNRLVIDEYKGKIYCYMDLSNLKGDEGINVLDQFIDFSKSNTITNPATKIVMNFENTKVNSQMINKLKEYAEFGNKLYSGHSIDAFQIAVVGISAIQKIFVNTFSAITKGNTKVFNAKEEALEWLISEK